MRGLPEFHALKDERRPQKVATDVGGNAATDL
jgi:hypothetical protein